MLLALKLFYFCDKAQSTFSVTGKCAKILWEIYYTLTLSFFILLEIYETVYRQQCFYFKVIVLLDNVVSSRIEWSIIWIRTEILI